ncbi:MAG: alpha/beta hydrolase [Acidimicrobiales bacterium]|nr:alpha/beta hydrolase [Acidimicrobiales bacterium]
MNIRPETEVIRFVGGSAATLTGVLHRPPQRAKGAVLMAHCFTCSKDIHTMTRLAKALTDAGYAAFRFDFTGRGESQGDFATKTLSGNVSDVVRAATTLIQMGFGPCAIVGHSLGGAAVLLAASRIKTLEAVITIGAPSDAGHVRHLFAEDEEKLLANGRAVVTIGGRTFELDAGFVHDLETHDVLEAVASLSTPYLTIHAEDDLTVPVTEGEALHAAAPEPKEFLRYATGGHLFANRAAADLLAADLVRWLNQTLAD